MQATADKFKITPTIKREIVKIIDERIREAHITREDFSELKAIVRDLAEAQKRTEEEVRKLAIGLNRTREDLGGVTRTLGYAFENEAYRMLPRLLKEKYDLELKERIIRAEIGGKEINFFGKAEKQGKEVYIVGEAKVRLDDTKRREDVLQEIQEKIMAVKAEYGEVEIMAILVTHFATKGFLKMANERGIIVVQSYEWN
ncbi:MAG: hypothetical protein PHC35_02135 [Deltaproteobacteria bacterium]|nr:hypothetical protein [Deltaproteobacteria bacterium]